ncbi:hypothetical protein FHX82_006620 [Amycolatopsis bartoniae]|uniref:Alanine-phosphoribitol ligase n=1 Tax=Amycolatopsis bartoniae TaxID=941986 RepID=A0A8H9IU77_9PSEU|nr:styrene monooxygenase/indole monooxygenase family protein [Amycolatopsis bartoniae]MBB2939534.1 hypothetical protein [Amycolatopsis bartoniae]TVT00042.1 FAD-binding oxidoreductase [Amycolatopsis bartoniae]GHF38994.1 alanine-phosphoribitol ligase [Amycolatopsis bartoniae]
MRKVLIVGAGQSGLQLALTLREHDYDVTVMSARTPEEIRRGKVMSTQAMFHTALQHERDHGLNLWEEQTVNIDGLGVTLGDPEGNPALNWFGLLDHYAQSVDQRVKMAGWLDLLEQRGGKVVIHGVTTADLDRLPEHYDLVIVAAGKGELVQLFDRDPSRSPYTKPQRALSLVYAHGVGRRPEHPEHAGVRFNIAPGVGELFMIPAFTLSGNCDILFFEGIPGGPLDCFADQPEPGEFFDRLLSLIRQYFPWEYERCRGAELTDSKATLAGGYTPVVRHPVGELPSGAAVLGMADVVVANDPITGQGSNNASKCAASYLDSILSHGDKPFDRAWMQATFDRYWDDAQWATVWTNAMLQPPPPHVQQILGAAQANPVVARRFVNGFSDPSDYRHWLLDPAKTEEYLASVSSSS